MMTSAERYQKYKARQAQYYKEHRDKYLAISKEQYRKVKKKVNKTCVDCGIVISPKSKERCRACNYLYHVGNKSSVYKGGRSNPMHPKHLEYRKEMHLRGKCVDCGKPITETAKRCNKCMGEYYSGERSPMWKGGVSTEAELIRASQRMALWRKTILVRDYWTCQTCGKVGGRLEVHHIKQFSLYPELRFDVDNGITLCVGCHKERHRKLR